MHFIHAICSWLCISFCAESKIKSDDRPPTHLLHNINRGDRKTKASLVSH